MVSGETAAWVVGVLLCSGLPSIHGSPPPAPVQFGRDVLPILSDRCFHCHGPDASHRKAKLRLDEEADAKRDRDGGRVIAPGQPELSELWLRVVSEDPDEVMPPPDSHRQPLAEEERELVRRWIEEGAAWGKHWAFEKPVRPAVPLGAPHPVDAFVQDRLASEGLEPSPPAPPHTQLRRLSFDLTGLPPLPEEIAVFEDDPTDRNWASQIDRLLASPHHGERMAMWWLDAARYADTDGYQQDAERSNWPWRDWVVRAFNDNLTFDRFTIEQFAGDLLPGAKPDQILATCFHRNHMTNGEGGRDPEESRVDYVIDRVNTTGTVWLGLTLGCTQCHDHKFDPVTQADYYGLSAFFNSIDEDGKAGSGAKPYLKYRSADAAGAVAELEAEVARWKAREAMAKEAAAGRFEEWLERVARQVAGSFRTWRIAIPSGATAAEGTELGIEADGAVQAHGANPRQDDYRVILGAVPGLARVTGWKLEVLPHPSHTGGKLSRGATGEFILTNVKALVRRKGRSQVREAAMSGAVAGYEREAKGRNYGKVRDTLDDDPRNGWTTEGADAHQPQAAVFQFAEPLVLGPDEELVLLLLQRSTIGDANIGRFRISLTDQAGETVRGLGPSPLEALARDKPESAEGIPADLRDRLFAQFLVDDREHRAALESFEEATRQLGEVKKAAGDLNVMVLAERTEPRPTHVLVRGVWDAKGENVLPGVLPAVLPQPSGPVMTRLDLAEWLVAPDNPLTARVVVNHLWQILFGAGLVRTPDDFGLQGERPTHPELLDWLAVELVESGWDLRHILRLIATSATYRQSSVLKPELRDQDPENRLLARAPRYRLPAWMIRDAALRSSGLLHPAVGGPPVKPWQPPGVWEEIFMGRFTYRPSVGPAQSRRTLYAYWRRSIAPTFLFDSAQRRVCEVRQNRTNTPLQALTVLNDITLLEAARAMVEQSRDVQEMAKRVLGRNLSPEERAIMERERNRALQHYRDQPDMAIVLATVGQQEPPAREAAPELAAGMVVAGMLFNLDEALSRE